MSSKKLNTLKITLIALSIIVICGIAYGSIPGVKNLPKQDKAITETTVISRTTDDTLRDSIVSFGMKLLGTPYASGSCSKDGFDCSGFVFYVFQHFKIQVPRSSSEFNHFGKEIPIENVKKGDILVFLSPTRNVIGHVGIVTNANGMQSDFIHSSSGREMKVIITSLKKEGYTRRFVKAVSVLGAI